MLALGLAAAAYPATAARAAVTGPWPTQRGDGAQIVAAYGERGRLIGELLHVGDPLADAVVAELARVGSPAKQQLEQGITHGLASLTNPPQAIAAFLRATESVPPWVTPRTHTGGSRAFMSISPVGHAQTLLLASLTHTYSSPAVAGVLVGTGELIDSTRRRIIETTDWLIRCMFPGALKIGAKGYVATLKVRLYHARARARALRTWDLDALGHPLGQVDLARTWLDFLPISYGALTELGFDLTLDEQADLYRTWWYLGYLLGIDPRFYLGITSHAEARQLLRAVDAASGPPNANSKALVEQTIKATESLFATVGVLPPLSSETIRAVFRYVNGDAIADLYGVPRSPAQALLPAAALATREARRFARATPFAWQIQADTNQALCSAYLSLLPTSAYSVKYGEAYPAATGRTMADA